MASARYELRPEPARNWLYGIAWNKLHEAQRLGQAEDAARRALGMAPIVLTDEGIERIETLAGTPALELMDALRDDPIATLDRELVDAARRRGKLDPGGPAKRRRGSLGAFAVVVLSGVAVVVALGALVSLIRRATVTPWGDRVYVIPLRPSGAPVGLGQSASAAEAADDRSAAPRSR
jgi:hypothetical protein